MYESPDFKEVLKEGSFSIRAYASFKTVSVDEASVSGRGSFSYLFGYISGQNKSNTSMKMTVPVINEIKNETMTMEFVIPKIHQDQTPLPSLSELAIKTYPETLIAVARFSGTTSLTKIQEEFADLSRWIQSKGYTPQGTMKIARYNAPFTPGFLRRNEIWISVKKV